METKAFMDKSKMPDDVALKLVLGELHTFWLQIKAYVLQQYPKGIEDWNFPGAKYGWSFRIKDKKRAIVYLIPYENGFKAALVFGEKATQQAYQSTIPESVKEIIRTAPVYAEGRGFSLEVNNEADVLSVTKLIDIKLAN